VTIEILHLHHEIFEHVDELGVHRFFDVTELRPYAVEYAERLCCPIEVIARHVEQRGGIEEWKVLRLREPYLSVPVLSLLWHDGSTLILDGNHRLVRLWRDGVKEFNTYRVKSLAECEPFLIKSILERQGRSA
jgi:hypothetical protein